MVLRLISAFLIALALVVSPLAMASGNAAAMPHVQAAAQAPAEEGPKAGGHCDDGDLPSGDLSSDSEMSCASACAAFPAIAPIIVDQRKLSRAPVTMAGDQVLIGIHPEGETPPPRITPEI